MNQPKALSVDAVRFFHEAVEWDKQGDHIQAYQLAIASINDDPGIPGAWNLLGSLLGKMKHFTSGAAAFHKALFFAPDNPMALGNYGWMLHLSGRSLEAKPFVERARDINPASSNHWTNLSQIYLSLDMYGESFQAGQKAVELAPTEPQPRLAMALAQLRMGDYQNGLREYEARFPYILPHLLKYPYPVWRGEDISNARLFIPCEQGIGDSVMFLRFVMDAAKLAKKVICHVHDNTFKLYRRNLPPNVELHPIPRELPAADIFCPALSLPVALQLSNEQIKSSYKKYKYAETHIHEKDFPKGKLKIAICWAGDTKHDNDVFRSSTLKDFLPLSEVPNARLYSLQIGPRSADLDTTAAHAIVKNLAPQITNVNDTCALLAQNIDAVVTVDTALAHMAGGMGVKTFVLLGRNGLDWRWGTGEGQSCWYPDTELIRQGRSGEWAGCIERVKKILNEQKSG